MSIQINDSPKLFTMSPRSKQLPSFTFMYTAGCGTKLYITITYVVFSDNSKHIQEVFIQNGKAGSCFNCHANAEGRLSSLYLRSGGNPQRLIKHLSKLTCAASTDELLSCPAYVAEALKETLEILKAKETK